MMEFSRMMKVMLLAAVLIGLSACASSRSTVSINTPENISNPANGVQVTLTVVDERKFEVDPGLPEIPSLSKDEHNDASIKARAIGRKRNEWGAALGDVILPEGHTVAGVMKGYMENAFREAGYVVLNEGDQGYDAAAPVTVHIIQYWCWLAMMKGMSNISEIVVKGPIPILEPAIVVQNEYTNVKMFAFDSVWQETATNGMKLLSEKLTIELKKAQ
ncbi:hypothetical protein J0X12_13840 [Sneathiella sp. CAU 1612]|uniref:Flagellar biosynthesis protein n=1 Tax=Sneathiella sedimenti TaxID=2816034 RepID=A0ABS3F875_9PROT|nr:hypothetical protein [Sneathiella sedimenti]MBO0334705.1 hypothetical protein [Sneathiella sedimenti]